MLLARGKSRSDQPEPPLISVNRINHNIKIKRPTVHLISSTERYLARSLEMTELSVQTD